MTLTVIFIELIVVVLFLEQLRFKLKIYLKNSDLGKKKWITMKYKENTVYRKKYE